jgi:osmotically-inducible protein OsmY
MKLMNRVTVRSALVVVMSAVVSVGVVRASARTDSALTLKAQSALQTADGFRMAAIHVDTRGGHVTLYGQVRSEKDKATATANVRSVPGVVDVRNIVQVVGPNDSERLRRSDAAVKMDLTRALRADRSLADSAITVKSVNNGVVLLTGTAASTNDIVHAFASAGARPSVRSVYSEIEAQRDAAAVPEAPVVAVSTPRPTSIEDGDDAIRRNVIRALIDLDDRANSGIKVMVKDGVVSLSGVVPTWDGNSSRLHAVRSVVGVRSINNSVRVVALAI